MQIEIKEHRLLKFLYYCT